MSSWICHTLEILFTNFNKHSFCTIKLLTNGNINQLATGRWVGVVWYRDEQGERFKAEAFKRWGTGKRLYRQSAAFILMLNTGLRTGEALRLSGSDIDLDKRVMHIQRGTKEVISRDGLENLRQGSEMRIGKLKSASSKRDVPLNSTAIAMIEDLRSEAYFGENTPLICDETGGFTRPMNFRKRYYRILEGAGLEKRGLHSLRHTFASTLVNGVKMFIINHRPHRHIIYFSGFTSDNRQLLFHNTKQFVDFNISQ